VINSVPFQHAASFNRLTPETTSCPRMLLNTNHGNVVIQATTLRTFTIAENLEYQKRNLCYCRLTLHNKPRKV